MIETKLRLRSQKRVIDKIILGKVFSINFKLNKRSKRVAVNTARLIEEYGLKNDVYAGTLDNRQVSLLAMESIREHEICPKVKKQNGRFIPGDFGENITVEGMDFSSIQLDTKIQIGEDVILKLSKIGRNCKCKCPVNHKNAGGCFILREGVFGRVIKGGMINKGDVISIYI